MEKEKSKLTQTLKCIGAKARATAPVLHDADLEASDGSSVLVRGSATPFEEGKEYTVEISAAPAV